MFRLAHVAGTHPGPCDFGHFSESEIQQGTALPTQTEELLPCFVIKGNQQERTGLRANPSFPLLLRAPAEHLQTGQGFLWWNGSRFSKYPDQITGQDITLMEYKQPNTLLMPSDILDPFSSKCYLIDLMRVIFLI